MIGLVLVAFHSRGIYCVKIVKTRCEIKVVKNIKEKSIEIYSNLRQKKSTLSFFAIH